MFNQNQEELNITCPRCKSENIYIGNTLDIKPEDIVKCNDCNYKKEALKFMDEDEIQNRESK